MPDQQADYEHASVSFVWGHGIGGVRTSLLIQECSGCTVQRVRDRVSLEHLTQLSVLGIPVIQGQRSLDKSRVVGLVLPHTPDATKTDVAYSTSCAVLPGLPLLDGRTIWATLPDNPLYFKIQVRYKRMPWSSRILRSEHETGV